MIIFSLFFLCGDLFFQQLTHLPEIDSALYFISFIFSICFFFWMRKSRLGVAFTAFLVGLTFSAWYADRLMSWTLPSEQEGKPVLITGYIASIPLTEFGDTQFMFALKKFDNRPIKAKAPIFLKLSWKNASSQLKVGDKWRLWTRLKRIHGVENPGGFDYEAWALQNSLRASGTVLAKTPSILLMHAWHIYPIEQIRQLFYERLQSILPKGTHSPWLLALSLGVRGGIAKSDWQILRNTGTNHLMAVAGLHIGFIAGFTYILVAWIWRRSSTGMLWIPASLAANMVTLIIAVMYSLLAGFSLPTQRACLMLMIYSMIQLWKRKVNRWYALAFAMLVVLVLNPLSVLSESFYLSFATLALIIFGMDGRLSPRGLWWKWGRVQWVIGVGLIPLTLNLYQTASIVSFFANSIAVPWLGFLILPFCFLSDLFVFISPTLAKGCLYIADINLSGLWTVLALFSDLPFSTEHLAIHKATFFTSIVGCLLLLLPSGVPGRWFGVIWLMPMFLFQPSKPNYGDYWVTLLDVGQGLSVVIQTQQHTLLYDAGPKYLHTDTGESVLSPFLNTIGARKIDRLVISHGDNDHLGGAQSVMKIFPVESIKTSVPEKIPGSGYCLKGDSWQWDGVTFSFLYPLRETLHLGNNSSCVLLIDNGHERTLLTGDIEKMAEHTLIDEQRSPLPITLLVAPHHGSKTSDLKKFITFLHPRFVLYSVGYRNRYRFPHQRVVASYQSIQATQLSTAKSGALQFKLSKTNPLSYQSYRAAHLRYWHLSDN